MREKMSSSISLPTSSYPSFASESSREASIATSFYSDPQEISSQDRSLRESGNGNVFEITEIAVLRNQNEPRVTERTLNMRNIAIFTASLSAIGGLVAMAIIPIWRHAFDEPELTINRSLEIVAISALIGGISGLMAVPWMKHDLFTSRAMSDDTTVESTLNLDDSYSDLGQV